MRRAMLPMLVAAAFSLAAASSVSAMTGDGCGSGACTDCHSLSREEAAKILGGNVDNVLSVDMSPVRGLREGAKAPAEAPKK